MTEKAEASAAPEVRTTPASRQTTLAEIKEIVRGVSERIDLTEAKIIVSGGLPYTFAGG